MNINLRAVLKGAVFAVLITFLIALVLALLSYFTEVGEQIITVGIYASVVIGVLLGTIAVSRAAEHKALLHALLVCVLYFAVIAVLSFTVNGSLNVNNHFMIAAGMALASGFLGCIIGK